jgi:hypothetical protein
VRVWWIISPYGLPTHEGCLRSRLTYKGICMVAFMDESGVNTCNVYSTISEIVRSHLRISKFLTLNQNIQLPTCQTPSLQIVQQWIVNHFNVNLVKIFICGFTKEGGDAVMR